MRTISFLLIITLCTFGCKATNEENETAKNMASTPDTIQEHVKENSFNCDYLGQQKPGDTPLLFGEGIISSSEDEYAFEISSTGKEMVISRGGNILLMQYNEETKEWSHPQMFPFSKDGQDGEASFSPDGTQIFFNSRRYCSSSSQASNIWIATKENNQWANAKYSGLSLPGKTVHAVSVAANGTVYTDGILKFEYINNQYSASKKLNPEMAGHHVFIAPDESYILFDKRVERKKSIYISYAQPDGSWTEPVRLNDKINSGNLQGNPYITPDQKYMFFIKSYNVYWVKADFLNELKTQ